VQNENIYSRDGMNYAGKIDDIGSRDYIYLTKRYFFLNRIFYFVQLDVIKTFKKDTVCLILSIHFKQTRINDILWNNQDSSSCNSNHIY